MRTIIGVAGDTRYGFRSPHGPLQYLAVNQVPGFFGYFVVRTIARNTSLAQGIANAYASVDPSFATPQVKSYQQIFAEDAATSRLAAYLFGSLALIALLLGVAGVYSVTAYAVAQRTHEFGIRRALGASDHHLLADVLARTARTCGLGIAVGLGLATLSARLLSDILFQTSPFDMLTIATAVLVVVVSTLVAALVPALRATRIEPAVALRYE